MSSTCGWCGSVIAGRHRLVSPFAFRGWVDHRPVLLDMRLVFHRACWATVRAVAAAAEALPDTWRPDDPPLTYCDECGADTYPATDHTCDYSAGGDAAR